MSENNQKLEGFEGPGFLATSLDKAVGMARKNLSGHSHLLLHAVELSSWQQWLPPTILVVLVRNV